MKADTVKDVKTLLSKVPDYNPELLAPKSAAAKNLAVFILAIIKYYEVSEAY